MYEQNQRALEILEDEETYAAAHVVENGKRAGVWDSIEEAERERIIKNFRKGLSRWATTFEEPDDWKRFPQQGKLPAYLGRRWKEAAGIEPKKEEGGQRKPIGFNPR